MVYEKGLKQIGVRELGATTELVNKTADRRATRIVALVRKRRELRMSLRRSQTALKRMGLELLLQ